MEAYPLCSGSRVKNAGRQDQASENPGEYWSDGVMEKGVGVMEKSVGVMEYWSGPPKIPLSGGQRRLALP
jgi:hypothetical protein